MPINSYVSLGHSGLRVSPMALGTMTFGEEWGWGASPEVSADILAAYLDHGGNFVDTANVYTRGHAETIVGDYLAARPELRDRLVLSTKFWANLHPGDPNGGGAGRKGIIRQLEDSLRRLGTDYVDLYLLNNFDPYWRDDYQPVIPMAETLRTLDDLVTAGKIRYVGMSNLPGWKIAEASLLAQTKGWTPMVALQTEYSLAERTAEAEVFPAARAYGIGVVPWGVLKNGFLSGKYSRSQPLPAEGSRGGMLGQPADRYYPIIDAVNDVAAEAKASPAAVATAWVRDRPGVTATLVGARTVQQLEANLEAVDLVLTTDQRATLDVVSQPELAVPAASNRNAPSLQFGGMWVDWVQWPEHPSLVR
ncbi:aldo/keto reductase [Actinoplanes sp. TBRC 11911]|uniref:aldo/keto reductase n=1 Tax=Actinoplanes sp. TBRC 11911 TaxID=2729386 RepID=UPI00145F9832|nr:aldo/keto reductase [Actinoplanes sp. TBRC 11911]NMO49932.1 aldo/keto reductase [Actinoplanes sp. TBRC 11911]